MAALTNMYIATRQTPTLRMQLRSDCSSPCKHQSHFFCHLAVCPKLSFLLRPTSASRSRSRSRSSWLSSQLSLSPYWLKHSIFIPLSFPSLFETSTIGEPVMSNCPLCDPSGSIAGLIGPQFCAAGSRPASSPLNPRAPVYQPPASSTRVVSLPRPSEGGPGSGSSTRPPEEEHASDETQSTGESHGSEERYASQETQSPRKRHASEDTGCPKKRQSLSPPLQKITSRGGSSSPEPAHSVRGGTSAPVAAPTPDVVARPPVDEEIHEIHETPKIQSHDPAPPLDQDQEKKPDRKPGPTWANVAQITKKQTNQSHLKIDVRPAKPK
ncbi:hypothetical protein CEK26_012038 [Fusarium fujikuroi]|nr:hypothetical protein CEK26_012038 [Fusarium fujikuroi]